MSNFMDGVKDTLVNGSDNVSVTENGAVGYRTTGRSLLDLNFAVASLRNASEQDISKRFIKAFFEDKVTAMSVVDLVSGGCSVPAWCRWRMTSLSMSPRFYLWCLSMAAGTISGVCWILRWPTR